jgi:hypothetical protein
MNENVSASGCQRFAFGEIGLEFIYDACDLVFRGRHVKAQFEGVVSA